MPLDKINLDKRLEIKLPSIMSVLINVFIGSVIGYLGPFGSYEMPLHSRWLYWVVLVGSGHFIYFTVGWVFEWLLAEKKIHSTLKFIIPSFTAAFLCTFMVIFVSGMFFTRSLDFYQNFMFFFPKVLILGLVLNVVGEMVNKFRNQSTPLPENHDKDICKKTHPFLRRLPNKIGVDLICFSMEDHYLHVHTEEGSHMMLLRMKDALVELEEYAGFQVHRSWWVASDAIVDVKKEPRKATLIMKNEMAVPVSKKYLPALKDAGLI